MNKHLVESTMRSIKFYQSEIEKMKEAIEVTKSVIKDRLKDLEPILPYKKDDILFKENRIIKLIDNGEIELNENDENGFVIKYKFLRQSSASGFHVEDYHRMGLSNWLKWKKLN